MTGLNEARVTACAVLRSKLYDTVLYVGFNTGSHRGRVATVVSFWEPILTGMSRDVPLNLLTEKLLAGDNAVER